MVKLLERKWTMRFDGSATTASNGKGIVLSCEDGDAVPLSFKLEFTCSNNVVEYEAYLTRLAIALSMGIKHMRVLATLGSQIPFKEESTLIKASKQQSSIIKTLKRMFSEEPNK